jgi:hypothetical protein
MPFSMILVTVHKADRTKICSTVKLRIKWLSVEEITVGEIANTAEERGVCD